MDDVNVTHPPAWNPLTQWRAQEISWVRVKISPEDMRRFTQRSNFKGLCQSAGFLLLIAATGTCAYYAFSRGYWVLLAAALYVHGLFYAHFGDALHELGHNTVFASRLLNKVVTAVFGLLYWPWNPYLYRLSHTGYHHRYTLYQGSDGEDTPNYASLTAPAVLGLFLRVVYPKALIENLGRLFTLKPTSRGWRGRGYALDTWEQFVLQRAGEADRRAVSRFAIAALVFHVAFAAVCIATGLWFLPVLITLAPFYGPAFHSYLCGTHQHACCQANEPDFRLSCGDAVLDPLSSFLYWHMEYHIEHHSYAAVPCYNLKAFSRFIADQMPPKESAIPRLFKLARVSREKFGTWQNWRDNFGRYKGF